MPSSESRWGSNSIEPFGPAKWTVTCLRSPSTALFEVTIFSATCLGVLGLGRSYIPIHAFHFTFYYQQPQW